MSERVILIADDDENDVLFLRQALEETCPGLRVLDVGDGEEAVEYLAGKGKFADRARFPFPGHLFLDVKMPRRNGLKVLEWIRAQAETRALPVIVLSGSMLSGDRERAEALGAEYFVKPVDYSALLAIARDFCKKAGFSKDPDRYP